MDNKSLFSGKIAVITGGSKGIGRATAKEMAKLGAQVCIIARNKKDLDTAQKEISEYKINPDQLVEAISCDTTDEKKLEPLLKKFIKKYGAPDYLINCVGYAYPQYLQKLKLNDFKKNMETNYYGQLVPILILLPYFLEKKDGHIVNVSSLLGLMGLLGYATYSPSKYAITGLSECLRHELKPHGIRVSVTFPPDTKTPGFDEENKSKPEEVTLISEGGGLMQPEEVARKMIQGIIKNRFHITPGESGFIWRVSRFIPTLFHKLMDGELKKAKKKIEKRKHKKSQ